MADAIKDSEVKMQKAVEALKKNFTGVRTGRANPALLDPIQVDYYGALVPLKQLSSVSAPEPRMLVVTPYDKGAAQAIEKAISSSNLGVNPKNEGGVIRLLLPELSEERRRDLTKVIKKEAEDAKIAVRNVRRDALSEKAATEDEKKIREKKVQDLTDKNVAEIDKLLAAKEKEILEV